MFFNKQLISLFSAFIFAVLVGTVSNTAIANTPDGETPANEGVCDGLHGGTPGLY